MIWVRLIEFWSLVMSTRRAEERSERKRRERGLERLNKGEGEGEACYFTAVWKIWLT